MPGVAFAAAQPFGTALALGSRVAPGKWNRVVLVVPPVPIRLPLETPICPQNLLKFVDVCLRNGTQASVRRP